MSSTNPPSHFTEDWNGSPPRASIPPLKPSDILQQELEPLTEDPILEPDVASHKAYAQGDTIGSAYLPFYLLAATKSGYPNIGFLC